jgi:hypothetical protein
MSILRFSIISKNILNGIVEKCKSLLPGSSHPEESKIVITAGSEDSGNDRQIVKKSNCDIIKRLEGKDCSFAALFFAVVIKMLFNKAVKNGQPTKLAKVIYSLKEYMKSSKMVQEACSKYPKKSIFFIIDMCIIIFFCEFFGKMMKQFLEDINQGIYYTLCLKLRLPKPIYHQRVSEFKATLGEDLIVAIIQEIKDYLYIYLDLSKVDDDLIEFVALGVSLSVNVSRIYNHYGFSKFLNFAFWHGLFAELEACIPRKRQQKKYSLSDLLFTYLTKLVEHGDNMDDLEKELKNGIEEGKHIINPCAQSFADLLADLDPEEVKEVQKLFARRVCRRSLKKGLIASADWTLIPVRGNHEGAYKCWDHVTNKKVMAYKLHVLFNSTDKQPLFFMFEEKDQTPTQILKAMIEETRKLLGVNRLGLVLYDKGYYNGATMKQICLFEELISPGKKFNAIKEAIEKLNMNYFVGCDEDGHMLFDTKAYFQDVDLTLRLVVVKIPTQQYVRTKSGHKKIINGHEIKENIIVYHSYLTNIPQEELNAAQVVNTYKKRWSIELFFKELKSNYGLCVLPSCDYRIVQNHVAMVFIMYMLVTIFKKALGGCFAKCSLKTLNKNFFRASLYRITKEHPEIFLKKNEEEIDLLSCLYKDHDLLLLQNN